MTEQILSYDEADNEYWEYLVEVKTEGYHQALRDVHKNLVKYAFTSLECSKVYNMCPKAFVKKSHETKRS